MPLMIKFEIAGDIHEICIANKSLINYINSKFFPYEKKGIVKGIMSGLKDTDEKLIILADLVKDIDKENLTFLNKTSIYKILQGMIDNRIVKPTNHSLFRYLLYVLIFVSGALFATMFFDKI